MIHRPTVAIIIPAYNEAKVIRLCLDAIAKQTDAPDEVIVVNNNSTDDTAKIAAQFPFVRLVNESTQGIAAARDRGFDEAKSDILGRIDADTIIPPTWVAASRHYYEHHPQASMHGLVGSAHYHLPEAPIVGRLMGRVVVDGFFFPLTYAMLRGNTFFGSNMAVTRQAWLAIRDDTCRDAQNLHEDIDIAVHLIHAGGYVVRGALPTVKISSRSMIERPSKFWWRIKVWPTAVTRHQRLFSVQRARVK